MVVMFKWRCNDSFARLDYEDSNGDIPIITLVDSGYWDFREFGGVRVRLILEILTRL
jgi:hypothetical protein